MQISLPLRELEENYIVFITSSSIKRRDVALRIRDFAIEILQGKRRPAVFFADWEINSMCTGLSIMARKCLVADSS